MTNVNGIVPWLRQDDYDVDGSPAPLRIYNQQLREDVAAAIRRFPDTNAKWWIGPEAVLAVVEQYILTMKDQHQ